MKVRFKRTKPLSVYEQFFRQFLVVAALVAVVAADSAYPAVYKPAYPAAYPAASYPAPAYKSYDYVSQLKKIELYNNKMI